jgi:ADP-ribosyl-[dinitrogen reductase] hydrolase
LRKPAILLTLLTLKGCSNLQEELSSPLSLPRYRGCLLGLAVGDALGTTVEFMPPGSFTPLTDMVGGGKFNLAAGEWTDDTSMALCLAESLVEKGEFDPIDQLERYLRWYHSGYLSSNGRCFDIGITTCNALHRFERTREPYPGPDAPHTAGSGSLMRLAPVPIFYARHPELVLEKCAESSRTTHGSLQAVDACRYYGALLWGALHGQSKEVLLAPPKTWEFVDAETSEILTQLEPGILEVTNGSFAQKDPPYIQGSGYVVRGMEAALWAFHHSTSFREGVLMAANLGDDADTTAAIYWQLVGAYYGVEGIPIEWRSKLAMPDVIIGFADKLWESSH